ncbi:microsomal triacylglycerol transfer protein [Battus philenor]|uniref:microsomal triacylglycerol transfer protein n=1 Tax=Battus philenor TaxID=42288 RepID=UPI0035CF427F
MTALTGLALLAAAALAAATSVQHKEYGEIELFRTAATYAVESMVLLNDAGRKDKEVGYKLAAALDVSAAAADGAELLLKFVLHLPQLLAKGKLASADYLPVKSLWDSYQRTEFYAHWSHGLVTQAYLDPEEATDVLNFKKSLISLFQLQLLDGERNETDASGACSASYHSVSGQVIRKTKRRCLPGAADDALASRRLTRYTLSERLDALDEVHAEEVHEAGYADMGAQLKARAWLRLRREHVRPSASPAAVQVDLQAALRRLPARLLPLPLPVPLASAPRDDVPELDAALHEAVRGGAGERVGGGGEARDAAAALRAMRALRDAAHAPARLAAALRAQPDAAALAALSRLAGAAGAAGVHAAVAGELSLEERDAPPPALLYLQALALAAEPDEGVVMEALRVGGAARAAAVREAALLAAGAAGARLPAGAPAAAALREALPRLLARCVDEECRGVHVRALANLARADTAELLLERAESGGAAALDALAALRALPASALGPARQRRLAALAASSARPLEQRAAALDLFLLRAAPLPPPLVLARLAHELHARGPPALRRLFWQRARQLADVHEPLAHVLAMLAPELRGWHALAQPGSSTVLTRSLGWFGAGEAKLESLQLARGALLRRGAVRLDVGTAPAPLLAVELWTRGLEALAGGDEAAADGDDDADDEATDMSGGLALTVGGARLPAITLFSGQAELLGHVWAGTGSSPTPVLRAILPLGAHASRVALLGAGTLHFYNEAALALALDAQAQVSLWSRTARAELELRVGVAGGVRALLPLAAGTLRARSEFAAEPRLRVAIDLDFYERVALCVRVATDDYELRSNTSLQSALGDAQRGVRRMRSAHLPRPGRTLALGALNDAACGALLA